jgi:hypothetical protein
VADTDDYERASAQRSDLIEEIYTMLDRGLGKRDASRLVEIIEKLVDLRDPLKR